MSPAEEPGARTLRTARIANAINSLVHWHGTTQGRVAEAIGVSENTLSRRMNKGGWAADELFAIAALFRVPINTLWELPANYADSRPHQPLDESAARAAMSKQWGQGPDLRLPVAV